jgi:lipid-A-disaccharide synthase
MVIAYNLNWLTTLIAKRMVNLDTATLVNLVSETRAIPECLLDDCEPDRIASALSDVAAGPDAQRSAMDVTMDRLGRGGEAPGLRAARAVLNRLPNRHD